jgi:hypothetical protein
MIKSWKIRWSEQKACMGKVRNAYRILVENQKRRGHLIDLGIDGR